MIPLTDIGTLVGIVKQLVELARSGTSLVSEVTRPLGKGEAAEDAVAKLQGRIAGIAGQLQSAVVLSKLLPLWLQEFETFDLYKDDLSDADVRSLDSKLRSLINASIRDQFSSTFFSMDFADLPEVPKAIDSFRERLRLLDRDLAGIPAGNAAAWRLHWAQQIKTRMSDLRDQAVTVNRLADEVHTSLIKELVEASRVAPPPKA